MSADDAVAAEIEALIRRARKRKLDIITNELAGDLNSSALTDEQTSWELQAAQSPSAAKNARTMLATSAAGDFPAASGFEETSMTTASFATGASSDVVEHTAPAHWQDARFWDAVKMGDTKSVERLMMERRPAMNGLVEVKQPVSAVAATLAATAIATAVANNDGRCT